MSSKTHLEYSQDNCRITVDTDERGTCLVRATGSVSKSLKDAVNKLNYVRMDPAWVINQLKKTITKQG